MNKERKLIYDKSGGRCWYCGEELNGSFHKDHFHPIVRTGDNKCLYPQLDCFENLVPSCAPCNLMKSSYAIEYFREILYKFVDSLNKNSTQYKFARRYSQVRETRHPVVFHFEQMGYEVPDMIDLLGVTDRVSNMDWEESDTGQSCCVGSHGLIVYWKGEGYHLLITEKVTWEQQHMRLYSKNLVDACNEAGVLYYGREGSE